jgi:hypothetical protein
MASIRNGWDFMVVAAGAAALIAAALAARWKP